MNTVAKACSGTWRCGDDPPDAYLSVNNREVAVEISILMQSRFDGHGGTVSLLSDAMPPTQLGNELNNELQEKIPHGRGVILDLKWPLSNKRAVKDHLIKEISQILSSGDSTRKLKIEGNDITIVIRSHDGPGYVTVVAGPSSLPHDDETNAWCALEERIVAKAEKCRFLKFRGPVWLALYDRYQLADIATHRLAMTRFSVDHPFEKILLVSREGSLGELFGQGPQVSAVPRP